MPKKINTDIGVNVSVTEVPDVKTVEIKAPSQPVGKTDLELLGDVLSAFNPKLAELAKADAERQAKEDYVLGANQVNGMTLEDARKAHQEGFPDIYNGWARVGAAKQYATNATENFGYEFKKRYIENRNDPNYRWQEDYAQQSSQFLQGKEKDPFFQGAFQKDNEHIKKWVAEHEFALQSKELKERVSTDLSFQIQNLPAKVEDRLFAEFRDTIPIETSGKDYEKRKVEYISQNFQKVFDEEFNNLKTRLNPALTKSDFDEIFLSSAEAYSKFDGRYSLLYAKQIMEQRPDGTPAIRFNPKFDEKAASVIKLLKKSAETEQFFEKMKSNITADISNEDYKKMSGEVFTSLLNRHKQTGLTDSQSFEATVKNLEPYLATNRPIPQIKELLNRPIGTTVTPDNRLALNVALMLDQQGALPAYFDGQENSSDTLKWRMAVMFYRNGEDPSNVIQKVGRQEQNKNISVLTEKEKQALGQAFKSGNQTLNNALNRDLVFSVAQYFKNVDSSGTAIETNTKNYIDKYYFRDAGGKFISRSRLLELKISEADYEPFKNTAVQMVNDYFKNVQPSVETVKTYGVTSKEKFYKEIQQGEQRRLSKLNYNPNNLEMVIDTDKRTIHFLNDNKVDYYDPVIITDKYGNSKRLQFNLEDVKNNYLSNKRKTDDEAFKKAQILEQAQKDYNAMKDMYAP